MLFIIAMTSGVTAFETHVFILMSSLVCMVCGFIAEQSSTSIAWVATILGWFVLLVAYTIILITFKNNASNAPSFVYAIVIGMFMMYMSFGIIHLIHLYQRTASNSINHVAYEGAYTIDSLISKTLLVILLFSGLVIENPPSPKKKNETL